MASLLFSPVDRGGHGRPWLADIARRRGLFPATVGGAAFGSGEAMVGSGTYTEGALLSVEGWRPDPGGDLMATPSGAAGTGWPSVFGRRRKTPRWWLSGRLRGFL
jgi:hypothetical protein